MKKINFVSLVFMFAYIVAAQGQEKGLFIALSGNYGHPNFKYVTDTKAQSRYPLGWGAGLSLHYFFNYHWGISLGAEVFNYSGKITYSNNWENDEKHFATQHMKDDGILYGTAEDYTLRLGVKDWTETQQCYILNVPLMLQYQTKWGRKEMIGMYWAAGIKAQIPITKPSFSMKEGTLQVLAYYPAYDLLVGEPYGIPNHGMGETNKKTFDGTAKCKIGVAAAAELGLLFNFSQRVDFAVALFLDYGFTNIKRRNADASGKMLMPLNADPHALDKASEIGDGIQYNGILQSDAVNKLNLMAFGGKATLRIKLGKLKEQKHEKESDKDFLVELFKKLKDTVIVNLSKDTIICPACAPGTEQIWNPTNPNSPNNPANPDYTYPIWYTPDYISDPIYRMQAGLGENQQGPNNPEAVKRNLDKVKAITDTMNAAIYFDLAKYDLRPDAIRTLKSKVELMKKYPGMHVAMVGHTCDLGSSSSNDELSQNRSIAARVYLIQHGIKPSRIEIISMGMYHPDHPNDSEAHRSLNRRVDFVVVE